MSRILVVDDIPANLQILSIHLTDERYEVLEANSGAQALEILNQAVKEVDLILLDVMMPSMTGLEVLAEIKKDHALNSIPVILVTANADDTNVAEGLDMGAFDYIIKPYSLVVLLARVRAALREKERLDLLEKWATTDPLTGLFNRRHFFELADREFNRAQRQGSPLSFILLDIDHFKQVNDVHGHLVGDTALVTLADLLRSHLRIVDFCCRFGGEEFVLCLPDTPKEGAFEVAERIREALIPIQIPTETGTLTLTISLGISQNGESGSVEDIVRQADDALYKAKESGRNQSQIAGSSS